MTYEHTVKRLRRLFTRKKDGWGARSAPEVAEVMAPYIEARRLALVMRRLPLAACEEGTRAMPGTGARESIEHLCLKRAAQAWMRAEGADDAEQEVRGYGGRFDVYSGKADWIVEAGNSSMDKLAFAIRDPDRPRFTLIPYQAVRNRDGAPRRLIAVDFKWDFDMCADFDNEMTARKRATMKAIDRAQRTRMIAEAQYRKAGAPHDERGAPFFPLRFPIC